jgi:hypothetical protein
LVNSAYLKGIQTGTINELPINTIQSLNQIYTLQEDYNDFGNVLLAGLINKEFSEKEEDIKKIVRYLSVSMSDIVIKEDGLLYSYNNVLNLLNRKE